MALDKPLKTSWSGSPHPRPDSPCWQAVAGVAGARPVYCSQSTCCQCSLLMCIQHHPGGRGTAVLDQPDYSYHTRSRDHWTARVPFHTTEGLRNLQVSVLVIGTSVHLDAL